MLQDLQRVDCQTMADIADLSEREPFLYRVVPSMLDSWLQDVRYAARLAAPQSAVRADRGAVARDRHRREHHDLHDRQRAVVQAAGGRRRARSPGRRRPHRRTARASTTAPIPNYLDIRARNTVFTGIYAYKLGAEPMSLGGRDGAERIFGDMVSTNYFGILGARPHIGRLFAPADGEQPARRRSPCSATSSGSAASTAIRPSSAGRCN